MNFGRCTDNTCRYNVDHQCTDKFNREKCIREEYSKTDFSRYMTHPENDE